MENKIELDNKYDNELERVSFYKDQPGYIPFIGKNYDEKRLFLIADSHYTHEEKYNISVAEWYNNGKVKFGYSTRQLIEEDSEKFPIIYNLETFLKELDIDNAQHPYNYVAFMNAFQRPVFDKTKKHGMSKDKRYLKDPKPDNDKAFEVITEVIKIIKPKLVMFLSVFVWERVGQRLDFTPKDYVPCSTCSAWNTEAKEYGNRTGSKKFVDCIQEHYK